MPRPEHYVNSDPMATHFLVGLTTGAELRSRASWSLIHCP